MMTAKPQPFSDVQSTPSESPLNTPSSSPSPLAKKRKFDVTELEDDSFSADCPDPYHKTRRVNPQRLAMRLGPDITAEMEALIYPGAKMPTFEVRKVIQEKYNVDRRHIYDYFHSRGLRVAKEDKHTNLTRGRMVKMQKQAPELEQQTQEGPASPLTAPAPQPISETADLPQKPVTPSNRKKPRATLSSITQRSIPKKNLVPSISKPQPQLPKPSVKESSPLIFSLYTPRTLPSSDDCSDSECSPAPEAPFLPSRPDSPTFLSSDPAASAYDMFDLDFPCVPSFQSDFGIDLPFHYLCPDSLVNIVENRPLTVDERMEMYNMISDNIGPAQGIEECKGSYRGYMEEKLKRHPKQPASVGLAAPSHGVPNNKPRTPHIAFPDKLRGLGTNIGKPVPVSQLISRQNIFSPKAAKDQIEDELSNLNHFSPKDKDSRLALAVGPSSSETRTCATRTTPRSLWNHSTISHHLVNDLGKAPVTLHQNNFRSFMFNARLRTSSAGGGI